MSRRRPIPRLISKRQKKYWRLPRRYHVMIDERYWPKRFPLWDDMPPRQKQDLMQQEAERISQFLDLARPIRTNVELMVTTGDFTIVPLGSGGPITVENLMTVRQGVHITNLEA